MSFYAKTVYGCLDTAKSLDNSLWSLSRSRSPKIGNVMERSRSIFSRSEVGVKNSDSVHLCNIATDTENIILFNI